MTWLPSGPNIPTGDPADPPPKWLDLIGRRPELDSRRVEPLKMKMTAAKFLLMAQVQAGVNNRVKYRSDLGDKWEVADTEGDCEDYALAKMVRLLGYGPTRERALRPAGGWPRGALRLALCYVIQPGRWQAHANLMVETDHGTWVLDNRMKFPRLWTRMIGYRWLWRESPGTDTWEKLEARR